jgi:hypothetical protein
MPYDEGPIVGGHHVNEWENPDSARANDHGLTMTPYADDGRSASPSDLAIFRLSSSGSVGLSSLSAKGAEAMISRCRSAYPD